MARLRTGCSDDSERAAVHTLTAVLDHFSAARRSILPENSLVVEPVENGRSCLHTNPHQHGWTKGKFLRILVTNKRKTSDANRRATHSFSPPQRNRVLRQWRCNLQRSLQVAQPQGKRHRRRHLVLHLLSHQANRYLGPTLRQQRCQIPAIVFSEERRLPQVRRGRSGRHRLSPGRNRQGKDRLPAL